MPIKTLWTFACDKHHITLFITAEIKEKMIPSLSAPIFANWKVYTDSGLFCKVSIIYAWVDPDFAYLI